MVLVLKTGLWLAIPVVFVLFFISSFRLIYLGWKTIRVNEQTIELSAPFWFTSRVQRADVARCETAMTDSRTVESEAGLGSKAHQPRLAQTYRWARLVGGWLLRINNFGGASVSSSVGPAPLLAIRFWLNDGSRTEMLIPDEPKVTPELVALLANISARDT